MYVPAVEVEKAQEYAVVGKTKPEVSTVGVVVTHKIVPPVGDVTVHDIDPAGIGFTADVPATSAVRVAVPPRVGELDALKLIVGTNVEMLIVVEFEVPAR